MTSSKTDADLKAQEKRNMQTIGTMQEVLKRGPSTGKRTDKRYCAVCGTVKKHCHVCREDYCPECDPYHLDACRDYGRP